MTTDRGGLSKPVAELLRYRPDVICLLSDGDFPDDAELSQVIKASRVPINTFLNLPYRWSRRDDRERLKIEGRLPSGAKDAARVKVAGVVPFIVMKGMALADRIKEKDAWDVWFCMRNYPGGTRILADLFSTHLNDLLRRLGVRK